MEKRRVVITGLGTVNPLGTSVSASWDAAKAGKCGIGPITQFDTTDFKCKLAGEVKDFDPETVVDKKEARKMARFTLLALAAAAEALADSGLDTEADAKTTGVILSSGIGGLPTIEEQHTRGEEKGMEKVSPYFVPMSIANMAAAQIAIRFGLKGICTCPVTACAGGTNAVGDAFHRIRDGYETAMVCGGAESCISPLGIGGFTSMKALSTATDPDAASLPFDARRGGFVMGEGSGVLVLEELDHAKARGAKIYAEVVGYGANCDAYHFTAPAPGGAGAIDCMKLTWQRGGDPTVAIMSARNKRGCADFTQGALPIRQAGDKSITTSLEIIETDFGSLRLEAHRMYSDDVVDLLDPQYWKLGYLIPFHTEEPPRVGTYKEKVITGVASIECTAPNANARIKNLTGKVNPKPVVVETITPTVAP